jgi:hypothetical protein
MEKLMLLRVYVVDRSVKWLLEVAQGPDTDFTVRQFLY